MVINRPAASDAVKSPLRRPGPRVALTKKRAPTLSVENELWGEGHNVVVGMDEVGRGAWAGPLAIGAAVLPQGKRVNGVRDSKMLTEREREALFDRVSSWCRGWAIGYVSHEECDVIGMSAAQTLAGVRALDGLRGQGLEPDRVLIDGNWDFIGTNVKPGTTMRLIKGDATCLSISAASVLAKVSRDRLMRADDASFPAFNFAENKGYPCPKHKAALQAYGPTSIHRRSWAFMDNLPWPLLRRVPAHFQPADDGQDALF